MQYYTIPIIILNFICFLKCFYTEFICHSKHQMIQAIYIQHANAPKLPIQSAVQNAKVM